MGNARHVNGYRRKEPAPTPQGVQLGLSVQVSKDPHGTVWMAITFGMGTMTTTLAFPADNRTEFAEMVTDSLERAYAEYQEKAASNDLLVPKSGLILPGNS